MSRDVCEFFLLGAIWEFLRRSYLIFAHATCFVSYVEFRQCGCANFNEYDEGHTQPAAQSLSNARGQTRVACVTRLAFLILFSCDSSLRSDPILVP